MVKNNPVGMDSLVVTITWDRYLELLKAENTLEALEAAGVDNWVGYDEALEEQYARSL